MNKVVTSSASEVFNLLSGIACIYKPAGETLNRVRHSFLHKISQELCLLESKPPTPYVSIEGDTTKPLTVKVIPSFVENDLVLGPKYTPSDFKYSYVTPLGPNTSGVLVIGLNEGMKKVHRLKESNPLRTYRVKGCLGEVRNNLFKTGKTVRYDNYKHVKLSTLEQISATIQASHQRLMFDLCGVDMQSETAYKLASEGVVRPANKKIPLIYSIKCVDFEPPYFTLEIQSINEYESYLMALIHDFGVKLHSAAYCCGIQCIRHSFFGLESALLLKHWRLQDVIHNISHCKILISQQKEITAHLNEIESMNKNNNLVDRVSLQ